MTVSERQERAVNDRGIEYLRPDPDGFREYVHKHKRRELVSKVMDEKEAVSTWTTVEEVLSECEHKPVLAQQIAVLDPPWEEELTIYRSELDVRGQTSDRGAWISLNGDKYERLEDGQ